jgi:dTDP-4-amino-4,6-dideoxygalactose transaminase
LKAQYLSIKSEIDTAIQNVISETAFIKGKYVQKFEGEYADAYGIKHCISCANGTDAIYITLKALGIGHADEVITVANTWISTSETISQTGAKPVFVDIHPDYYTIDISKIEEKITSKTKAIIPVHLFGQPAEMDAIVDICKRHNLFLVEDCAQAHFAEWKGKRVGTMGIAGTFSFFPGKNLGAYGDAGAIVSNDDEFAIKARMFANHGALKKHHHELEGINSRMDGLQAAILSVKLKYIHQWTDLRIQHAETYSELLSGIDNVVTPVIHQDAKHVFHLYVIRTQQRSDLQIHLKDKDISSGIHYPTPLPFLKAYEYLGYKPENLPISYNYMDIILSLPMYPELKKEEVDLVCGSISEFYSELN